MLTHENKYACELLFPAGNEFVVVLLYGRLNNAPCVLCFPKRNIRYSRGIHMLGCVDVAGWSRMMSGLVALQGRSLCGMCRALVSWALLIQVRILV